MTALQIRAPIRQNGDTDLISPHKLVALPILEPVPGVKKLRNPVLSDVLRELSGVFPFERRP